jgi:hypothetical protein
MQQFHHLVFCDGEQILKNNPLSLSFSQNYSPEVSDIKNMEAFANSSQFKVNNFKIEIDDLGALQFFQQKTNETFSKLDLVCLSSDFSFSLVTATIFEGVFDRVSHFVQFSKNPSVIIEGRILNKVEYFLDTFEEFIVLKTTAKLTNTYSQIFSSDDFAKIIKELVNENN